MPTLTLISIVAIFAAAGFIFLFALFVHAGEDWNRD